MADRFLQRQSFGGAKTVKASSATTDVLVVSNPSRTGCTIYNDSTAALSIACTEDATELDVKGPDVIVAAGGYFECLGNYCGPIYGKWASANGNARIKEYK